MCNYQAEFAQLNTRILIVSFGTFPAVQNWLSETCAAFTVLLDRERAVYNAYGLERSRLRSRSPRTLWLYFTRWLQGQKFHEAHGDDTSQLGGNFIVDTRGLVRYAHPSYDPADRPPVSELLSALKKIK